MRKSVKRWRVWNYRKGGAGPVGHWRPVSPYYWFRWFARAHAWALGGAVWAVHVQRRPLFTEGRALFVLCLVYLACMVAVL
ncbi:hypothetical protein [Rhizobium phage RHph_X2_26]|nr:hypothetical protein [Rhizobium phage RHph_X2_26]